MAKGFDKGRDEKGGKKKKKKKKKQQRRKVVLSCSVSGFDSSGKSQ